MATRVVNVMGLSPYTLGNILRDYDDVPYETSPIYTTARLNLTVSGSYTSGSTVYSYSFTTETTLTRESYRGGGTIVVPFWPFIDSSTMDHAPGGFPTVGGCYMLLDASTSFGAFNSTGVFYSPRYQFMLLNGNFSESSLLMGTSQFNSDPPINIVSTINPAWPTFTGSSRFPTLWRASMPVLPGSPTFTDQFEVDVSAWSDTKWRDFRGVYSDTITDDAGSVSATLEWELS